MRLEDRTRREYEKAARILNGSTLIVEMRREYNGAMEELDAVHDTFLAKCRRARMLEEALISASIELVEADGVDVSYIVEQDLVNL